MTGLRAHRGTGLRGSRPAHLLPILVMAMVLFGTANAFAITRDTVLAHAQRWIDSPIPYSQSKYFGGYRTDCSGFASMTWQLGQSMTTRTLQHVSRRIPLADLRPGDVMLAYDNHVRVFYGWVDSSQKDYVAYEQTGARAATPWTPATPSSKSSIQSKSDDYWDGYRAYRYDHITDGPRPWNALANATFDVWDAKTGLPVWWEYGEKESGVDRAWTDRTRSTNLKKVGTSQLRLTNPASPLADVVEVRQTAPFVPGKPYLLSMWTYTSGAPAGLELRVRFSDAAGNELLTKATTGDSWGINPLRLRKMSLTATAPADATTATVSVRLAGPAGLVATSAVLDFVRFYDASPVSSTCTVSQTSVEHAHSVSLRGRVTAPIAVGTVRIYMIRPGKTASVFLADRPLVGGAWSMPIKPTVHGTYTFTAKYLGYGPYGPVTSTRTSLRVK